MPIPAPKSLEAVFQMLNKYITAGKKLWDMDYYRIEAQLKEALAVQPVPAFVYLGMLATLKDDERAMREYFRKAFAYGQYLSDVNFNYALSLLRFGYFDEAAKIFMVCIQGGAVTKEELNEIACAAVELNNYELSEKVLQLAEKLNFRSEQLRHLALHMMLSTADSTQEEVELLEIVFPDEVIKRDSSPLTAEEWTEMQSFAEELKQYM